MLAKLYVLNFFKKIPKTIFFCLIFFLAFALAPKFSVKAYAATYYSSPSGSGTACSLASPCNLNTGLGKLIAGDTLYLRAGIYQQKVSVNASGTSGNRVAVSGYPGETAIIDGNNYTLPTTHYDFLVSINGNYTTLKDLEIRKSKEEALSISGNYNTALNIVVHDNNASGIIISGDYDTVDNCTVYNNGQAYENCSWKSGFTAWGSALACGPGSSYGIIKNCTSYNNWGEGISAYTSGGSVADHCTIEDSVSYNNGSVHLYLQNVTNCTVQRNIIYRTSDTPRSCTANVGLQLGDEGQAQCNTGHNLVNNLVMGTWLNFSTDRDGGCTGNPLANTIIAYNTFANAYEKYYSDGYNMSIYFRPSQAYSNTVFKNNIILEDSPSRLTPISVPSSHPGLTFSNNLYSKAYSLNAVGSGDVQADPRLEKTGSTGAGLLSASWFKLLANSPAIDHGTVVAGVTEDYFKTLRGALPDIGAHEYQGTILPTSTPLPSVIPTTTRTPTPTQTPALTSTSTPTQIPSPTSIPFCQTCPSGVPPKSDGNANCDSKVDLSDYTIWVGVYRKVINNQSTTEQERAPVDFNCQPSNTTHTIGLDDYVVWLRTYRASLGG